MSRYQLSIELVQHAAFGGVPLSDPEQLIADVSGVVQSAVEQPVFGRAKITARLNADDELAAVNSVLEAAQRRGYQLLNGEISKIADRAVEGAILGAVTGGGGGGVTTRRVDITIMAAFVGFLFGHYIGSKLEEVEQIFAVRPGRNGWTLTPVETVAQTKMGLATA